MNILKNLFNIQITYESHQIDQNVSLYTSAKYNLKQKLFPKLGKEKTANHRKEENFQKAQIHFLQIQRRKKTNLILPSFLFSDFR